jgi:phage gp36-like protein
MPDYCTRDEVVDVLTRDAAEVEGNGASVDGEAVDKAILDAEAEIDSRLGIKYTVPFNPVPPLIASIAQDIAAYLADLVFRENRDYQSELSPIYLRYQRAQAQLGRLQTGEAIIPPTGSDPDNPPDTGSGLRVAAAYSRPPLIDGCEFDIRIGCSPARAPYWTPEGWAIH